MGTGKDVGKTVSPMSQLWGELKSLQTQFKEMKAVVGQLKDMLLTKDNWHSKITKWVDKEVEFGVDPARGLEREGVGILKWADRYHIGVEVNDGSEIKLTMINKGHIVYIREA